MPSLTWLDTLYAPRTPIDSRGWWYCSNAYETLQLSRLLYHKHKQFFNADRTDINTCGHGTSPHHCFDAIRIFLLILNRLCRKILQFFGRAVYQTVLGKQLILLLAEQQLSFMDEGNVITKLLKVTNDMGRNENGELSYPAIVQLFSKATAKVLQKMQIRKFF